MIDENLRPCAGDNTIAALLAGAIDPTATRALDVHLDACAACRRLVADLGRGLTALDDDRLPRPGDRVGRYDIVRTIGVGGMGVVFEARDTMLDRRVAIKVLRPDIAADLLGEARAMAKLAHRNVVAIYDVGTVRKQVYLCMELLAGVTLREWLAVPRSPREIIDVFVGAGRGLAYVHERGLVHLDFKPENVMVDRGGRAVVTDFGVGAMAGVIAGTPAYMAPEQRRGAPTDARADQFAFCTALANALGNRAPSWARSALERGRSDRREDRFATMDALLAILEAGVTRKRRLVRSAALVAAAAVVAVTYTRSPATITKWIERAAASQPLGHQFQQIQTRPIDPLAQPTSAPPLVAIGNREAEPELRTSYVRFARAIANAKRTQPSVTVAITNASRSEDSSALLELGDSDAAVPRSCDDGSSLRCSLTHPQCAPGDVIGMRAGCWQCVASHVCGPHFTGVGAPLPEPPHAQHATPETGSGTGTNFGSGVENPTCGNFMCEVGEDHVNCPSDCCPLNASGTGCAAVCGNGFCEIDEDQTSCPTDCF